MIRLLGRASYSQPVVGRNPAALAYLARGNEVDAGRLAEGAGRWPEADHLGVGKRLLHSAILRTPCPIVKDQSSSDSQAPQGQGVPMKKKHEKDEGPALASIRLKRLRTTLGLKQREMAKRLGDIPQDHYKHFEGRTRPTREIIAAIEKQFGLPPSAFLDDESISEADFNHMTEKLRDGMRRDGTILIPGLQMGPYAALHGDAGPREKEGVVGQGSIDFILTTLAEIKADIAKNKAAIAELKEGHTKPGFRKGRS